MNNISLPNVSIVVIGHNESKNLEKCFMAIRNMNYPQEKIEVIYVDSRSTDNSVEIAKKYTSKVFIEWSNWPTAGEAFNKGIKESSNQFIHITAGDILLDKNYLITAINTLLKRNDIHAVTGYFLETNNKGWNKFLAYRREEDSYKGDHFVETPNGGTFRKESFLKVNGYDERIKKGQETEIGKRFAKENLKIWYLNIPQGIHDFDVNTLQDMIKRYINLGLSYGYLFLLSKFEPKNDNIKPFRKTAFKNLFMFSCLLSILILTIALGKYLLSISIIACFYIIIVINVLIKQRNKSKNHRKYFIMNSLFSIFIFIGIIIFFFKNLYFELSGKKIIKPKKGLSIDFLKDLNNE